MAEGDTDGRTNCFSSKNGEMMLAKKSQMLRAHKLSFSCCDGSDAVCRAPVCRTKKRYPPRDNAMTIQLRLCIVMVDDTQKYYNSRVKLHQQPMPLTQPKCKQVVNLNGGDVGLSSLSHDGQSFLHLASSPGKHGGEAFDEDVQCCPFVAGFQALV